MIAVAVAYGACAPAAQAQGSANPEGCTLAKGVYTCNRPQFVKSLRAARTVSIETQPMDRVAAAQLRDMLAAIGKTAVPLETSGDLIMLLIPADRNAVLVGPGQIELATLRVYALGPNGSRGSLLWAETYTGEADRPWPTTVRALIQQFEAKFGSSSK